MPVFSDIQIAKQCFPLNTAIQGDRIVRDKKEKRFEIDSKKIELDFLRQQFLVECKRFAAKTIEGKIRSAIASNPEKVFSLGKEGLSPIKEKVNHLLDHISDRVEEVMNQDELWCHTRDSLAAKDFPEDLYLCAGKEGPQILAGPIQKILSPMGEILLKHGLDTPKNWDTQDKTVLYRHPLDWTKDIIRIMDQYHELFNELSRLIREYEALDVKNSGNDALELWDSI